MEQTGLIVKAVAGVYSCLPLQEPVEGALTPLTLQPVECHARGVFRYEEITPLTGDLVRYETDGTEGRILEILPRKNAFTRPPLANLDRLFLVTAVTQPAPSTLILDKLITVCEYKGIAPVLVITKTDLGDAAPLRETYELSGFPAICLSNQTAGEEAALEEIRALLQDGISAFCGNTGVGKSSLLNRLYPDLGLATGEVSRKLGRGRHTTRHVELYPVGTDGSLGFVADTPGFGTMELLQYEVIRKEELQYCFREFKPYLGKCRFQDCAHTAETGCAVLEAVQAGRIPASRHASYRQLYEEARQIREWELPQGSRKGRR